MPASVHPHSEGSHAVRVGIMDTGVDGKHSDIAPNFDRFLSRNFTGQRRAALRGQQRIE